MNCCSEQTQRRFTQTCRCASSFIRHTHCFASHTRIVCNMSSSHQSKSPVRRKGATSPPSQPHLPSLAQPQSAPALHPFTVSPRHAHTFVDKQPQTLSPSNRTKNSINRRVEVIHSLFRSRVSTVGSREQRLQHRVVFTNHLHSISSSFTSHADAQTHSVQRRAAAQEAGRASIRRFDPSRGSRSTRTDQRPG